MALFRFLVFFSVIIYVSCSLIEVNSHSKVTDTKPDQPVWDIKKVCLENKLINARSNKIICLICTGFDPSCFDSKTNSTSTTGSPIALTNATTKSESMTAEASADN